MKISNIHARELLDSRGNPTIEVDLELDNEFAGSAIVPSGASTGEHEAVELRDKDLMRFLGNGVLQAVKNVNTILAKALNGQSFDNQSELVAAALAIALKPNSAQLSDKVISGNIKPIVIKPMPRPGSFRIKPTSLNSENSILPTLGSVETGLAIVQFGSFENKQLALAEWGRLSENLSVILNPGLELFETDLEYKD